MGLGRERRDPALPGLVADLRSEMNQRAFYRRWQDALAREPRRRVARAEVRFA
jgi:hypothetical protein